MGPSLVYAKLHIKGMLREFFGPGRDDFARLVYGGSKVIDDSGHVTDERIRRAVKSNSNRCLDAVRYAALSVQAVTYGLFMTGCAYLFVRRRFLLALGLLFPIAYVLVLSGGPEAFSRFRVSYMPFVCIIAAFGFECMRAAGTRLWLLRMRSGAQSQE